MEKIFIIIQYYFDINISEDWYSGSLHSIHHTVHLVKHEENGETPHFDWGFNIPNLKFPQM